MTTPLPSGSERRQFFRIIYPAELSPEVVILGTTFRVLDISEKAVRFRKNFNERLDTGQSIKGVVIFLDYSKFEFQGYVLRVINREVVVNFLNKLPYQKLMAEQVLLQRNKK